MTVGYPQPNSSKILPPIAKGLSLIFFTQILFHVTEGDVICNIQSHITSGDNYTFFKCNSLVPGSKWVFLHLPLSDTT